MITFWFYWIHFNFTEFFKKTDEWHVRIFVPKLVVTWFSPSISLRVWQKTLKNGLVHVKMLSLDIFQLCGSKKTFLLLFFCSNFWIHLLTFLYYCGKLVGCQRKHYNFPCSGSSCPGYSQEASWRETGLHLSEDRKRRRTENGGAASENSTKSPEEERSIESVVLTILL